MDAFQEFFVSRHLLSARVFFGAVFFEVPEIALMEMTLLSERRNRFADEMPRGVRAFIPVAVALLYVSRAAMFWVQYSARPDVLRRGLEVCSRRRSLPPVLRLQLPVQAHM